MRELRGANALLTGASGGIGSHIARGLAAEGVALALSGRAEQQLDALRDELRRSGARAETLVADLSDPAQAIALADRAAEALGPLDLLVSNAGIEITADYTEMTDAELQTMVGVNLLAPMLQIRHVLPGMLERGRGHVVVVASLAGKGGTAYNAAYGSTKAALVGLVRSLRVELAHSPVGLSVICPGFVSGEGMYERMEREGLRAPPTLRAVPLERVVRAVIGAIVDDKPEVLVTSLPMRPLLALQELLPRPAEKVVELTGAASYFRRVARQRGRA